MAVLSCQSIEKGFHLLISTSRVGLGSVPFCWSSSCTVDICSNVPQFVALANLYSSCWLVRVWGGFKIHEIPQPQCRRKPTAHSEVPDYRSCLLDDPVSPGWTMARGGLSFAAHAHVETSAQWCDLQHGPALSDTNCLSCLNIAGPQGRTRKDCLML